MLPHAVLCCAAPPLQARHAQIDTETALAALKRSAAQREVDLDAEDEEAVRQMLLQVGGGRNFVVNLLNKAKRNWGGGGRAA